MGSIHKRDGDRYIIDGVVNMERTACTAMTLGENASIPKMGVR